MKNNKYNIVSILGLLLLMVSCGGSGGSGDDTPITDPKPTELTASKIVEPKNESVCQGVEDKATGTYAVKVQSQPVLGAEKYIFTLQDSSGKELPKGESTSPNFEFKNVLSGHAYTLTVTVKNAGGSKVSSPITFSTPGAKVVDYVPVVKSAFYDETTTSIRVVFHDKESTDNYLIYTLLNSETNEFRDDNGQTRVVVPETKVESDKQHTILLESPNGSIFYRLKVKDSSGNMSSYDIIL